MASPHLLSGQGAGGIWKHSEAPLQLKAVPTSYGTSYPLHEALPIQGRQPRFFHWRCLMPGKPTMPRPTFLHWSPSKGAKGHLMLQGLPGLSGLLGASKV